MVPVPALYPQTPTWRKPGTRPTGLTRPLAPSCAGVAVPMSGRSKAPQMHQRWWAPRALLSPPQSVAVAPLSSQAAAPSHTQPTRSHSPLVLRVLQLALVLVIGSVCRRVVIHSYSSGLGSTAQPRRQWEQDADLQYEDGIGKTATGGGRAASGAQGDWSEYECTAWREASSTCAPSDRSADQQLQSRGCDESISLKQHSSGGFCELRHKRTGESKQVLTTPAPCYNSNDTRDHTGDDGTHTLFFKCADFRVYLTFAQRAAEFKFDPDFSFGKCRQELIDDQVSVNRIRYASAHKIPFQKGIAIVHQSPSDLESVFKSIQRLRRTGCTLPIEFWYTPQPESEGEAQGTQVLLHKMTKTLGVYLRTMKSEDNGDDSSAFEGPFAKAYAAFYSAFDKVLVLDGTDNLAALITSGNPAHLFTAKEFVNTGAAFWQDEHRTEQKRISSFVATLFGLQSSAGATLFPQDTGRLLIDRRRHLKALNTLMYYVKNYNQIDLLQIVNSEKELFQIAWAATSSAFHVATTTSSSVDPDSRVHKT